MSKLACIPATLILQYYMFTEQACHSDAYTLFLWLCPFIISRSILIDFLFVENSKLFSLFSILSEWFFLSVRSFCFDLPLSFSCCSFSRSIGFLFIFVCHFHQVSDIIKASLAIILLGVGFATVFDVELNFLGSVYAIIAVLCTTLGQVYTNSKQKELGLNPMQLLHRTSPTIGPSSLRCLFCLVFLSSCVLWLLILKGSDWLALLLLFCIAPHPSSFLFLLSFSVSCVLARSLSSILFWPMLSSFCMSLVLSLSWFFLLPGLLDFISSVCCFAAVSSFPFPTFLTLST